MSTQSEWDKRIDEQNRKAAKMWRLAAAAPDLLAALTDVEKRLAGAGMLGAADKVSRAIAKATKQP